MKSGKFPASTLFFVFSCPYLSTLTHTGLVYPVHSKSQSLKDNVLESYQIRANIQESPVLPPVPSTKSIVNEPSTHYRVPSVNKRISHGQTNPPSNLKHTQRHETFREMSSAILTSTVFWSNRQIEGIMFGPLISVQTRMAVFRGMPCDKAASAYPGMVRYTLVAEAACRKFIPEEYSIPVVSGNSLA